MQVTFIFWLIIVASQVAVAKNVLKPRVLVEDGPQTAPDEVTKSTPTIGSSFANEKGIEDDDDKGFDREGGLAMINDAQFVLNELTPYQRMIVTIRFQTATILIAIYKKNVFELLHAKSALNNTQSDEKSSNQISISEINPLHTTPWYYRNKHLIATFVGDESVCWQIKKLCHEADIDHRHLTARQLSLVLADKMHEASMSNTIIPCNILITDLQNLDSFSVDMSGSFQLMKAGAIGFQNAKINQWMETKGRKLAFDILARQQNKSQAGNNNVTTENNENSTFSERNPTFNSINSCFYNLTFSSDLQACFEIFQHCQQEMLPFLSNEKSSNFSVEVLSVHKVGVSQNIKLLVNDDTVTVGPCKLASNLFDQSSADKNSSHFYKNNSCNSIEHSGNCEELLSSVWSEVIHQRQQSSKVNNNTKEDSIESSYITRRRWKRVL